MLLKRQYDEDGKIIGIEVQSLGASQDQHFTPDLVATAIRQGWMTRTTDSLVLICSKNGPVEYEILRTPGYYCCHCGEVLDDGGQTAQLHVAEEHPDTESPDPSNPSGYERIHYFDCVERNPRPEK